MGAVLEKASAQNAAMQDEAKRLKQLNKQQMIRLAEANNQGLVVRSWMAWGRVVNETRLVTRVWKEADLKAQALERESSAKLLCARESLARSALKTLSTERETLLRGVLNGWVGEISKMKQQREQEIRAAASLNALLTERQKAKSRFQKVLGKAFSDESRNLAASVLDQWRRQLDVEAFVTPSDASTDAFGPPNDEAS